MSYRSFKHVLGETHLERKCFFLFGSCLLLVITGSFWWYSQETDQLVRDATKGTARGLADTILYRRHWDALETQQHGEFEQLTKKLGEQLASQEYKWTFIRPNVAAADQSLDETEI